MVPRCVFRTNWVTTLSIRLLLQVPKRPWSWFWKLASSFDIVIPPIHRYKSSLNPFTMLFRQALWLRTIHGWSFVPEWCVRYKYLWAFLTAPFGWETDDTVFIYITVQYFQILKCKTAKTDRRVNLSNVTASLQSYLQVCHMGPNKAVMLSLWLRFLTSPNVSQCQFDSSLKN